MAIKKKRSPNYPAMSLPAAIELVKKIYDQSTRHPANNEAFAAILGYKGLSGRALRVIATLSAFGLLEGRGDDLRVSEHGETICIDPEDSGAYVEAVKACANTPPIYQEVFSRFDDKLPGDQILKAFLLRKEFAPDAANRLSDDLKETYQFIQSIDYNTKYTDEEAEEASAESNGVRAGLVAAPTVTQAVTPPGGRELFSYTFEPSGSMRLIISEDVDPKKAIVMLKKLIQLKEAELAMAEEESDQLLISHDE
ncbi:MAG: hypothetical protein AAGL17_13670 [Cyanobacteria bacterium J06576_12]